MTVKTLEVLAGTQYRVNVYRHSHYYEVTLQQPVFDSTDTYIEDWDDVDARTMDGYASEADLERLAQELMSSVTPSLAGDYYGYKSGE